MSEVGAWSRGVDIETMKLGKYREIHTSKQAAEMLLFEWPVTHGPAYSQAQMKCLAALEGKGDPQAAREAFIRAATEADLFVRKQ